MRMKPVAFGLLAAFLAAPAVTPAQARQEFVTVQPAGQHLVSHLIGQPVTNETNETIGDINDVLFDSSGRLVTVVIGVGGFLGIGEKDVAIAYSALELSTGADGKRVARVALSKETLQSAPEFKATEKTVFMRAKEQATEMGRKAADEARELKDRAARKIEDMRSGDSKSR